MALASRVMLTFNSESIRWSHYFIRSWFAFMIAISFKVVLDAEVAFVLVLWVLETVSN